ncbi:MAG: protein translocase subunit SecF [Bacteroidetes bacterium]|nr:protein translocase subunit SecF [Bacteroidota bacterium]
MRLLKKTNINFLGARKICYAISGALVLVGILSLIFGGLDFGIDFRGGTELIVKFSNPIEVSEIRSALDKVGLGRSEIKLYGGEGTMFLIRTTEQGEGNIISDKIKETLQKGFPTNAFEVLREDKIGPKIGKELRLDALYAVLWSLVAILIYVAFRFKYTFGIGAVVALMHDVLTTFAFLTIINQLFPALNVEITQEVIAAFLTIIGVSVNDTVVIFDRIRENLKLHRSLPLMDVMNQSVNETLSRTIITNGTIFLVLLVLLLFGGEVLRGFALTLTFGTITGTYSTIYIASSFVLDFTNYMGKRKKKS